MDFCVWKSMLLFVVATALGATSMARKEGSYGLPLLGVALAAAAMVNPEIRSLYYY